MTLLPFMARPSASRWTFGILAVAAYAICLFIARRIPAMPHPDALAAGVAVDLTVSVPLFYYFLCVRGRRSVRSVVPVVLLGLAAAALILPPDYRRLVMDVRLLALPAELALVSWVVWKVWRSFRGESEHRRGDILERTRQSLRSVLGDGLIAGAVASELALLYYALLSWRARPPVSSPGEMAFTYHRKSGYGALLGVIGGIGVVELAVVHLLVHRWSPTTAWVLTGLGFYGLLWLLGDFQALRLRPWTLDGEALHVRVGLRWSLRVPLSEIAAIQPRPRRPAMSRRAPGYLRTSLQGDPQLLIDFRNPLTAEGMYGLRKEVKTLGVRLDEPAVFQDAMAEALRRITP